MLTEVSQPALLLRIGGRTCALPLPSVVEILRPLPIEPLAGAPDAVRGLSIVHGVPVPVVDLGILLGVPGTRPATRFVAIRVGQRRVCLAVEEVLGIGQFDHLPELPPLLRDACAERIEAIGALDSELIWVLKAGRMVDESAGTAHVREVA